MRIAVTRLAGVATCLVLAANAARADILLRGSASRIDSDGSEQTELDGSFLLEVQDAPSLATRVEVQRGRWQVEVRVGEGAYVRPVDLELGGRACLGFAGWSRAHPAVDLVVRGQSVDAPSVLRVVAAEDGRELQEVEVVATGFGCEHPGPVGEDERLVESAPSPVTLPLGWFDRRMRNDTCWVRAPGRAWKRIAIDPVRGGERRVELHVGGSVELTFAGPQLGVSAKVFCVRPARPSRVVFEAPYDARGMRVDGLPPGEFLARVVHGHVVSCPLAGEAAFVVEAGSATRSTVALDPQPPPRAGGRIEGSIALPADWHVVGCKLELRPLEDDLQRWITCSHGTSYAEFDLAWMQRGPDGLLEFVWDAPFAGRYVARLRPLDLFQVFEVAGGANSLHVEVPRAARVVLRVVDAGTGETLAIRSARWWPLVDERFADSVQPRLVVAAPDTKSIQLEVPSGSIHVQVRTVDGRKRSEELTLAPGEHELAWRLEARPR